MKLRKCKNCQKYTLKEKCSKCEKSTKEAHYKYITTNLGKS